MLLPVSFIENLRPEASTTQRTLSNSHSPQHCRPSFMLLILRELYWIFFFFFFLHWILIIDFPSSSLTVQFSSVAQSCPTLCDTMDYSMADLPFHQQLQEFTQTHVHWVGDAIQLSHPLLSPSPPAFNHSQNQGFFQWVSSLHQGPKVLQFQLQHQSSQWILRTDLL